MRAKIRITCKRCKCAAEYSAETFVPSNGRECPNCGQALGFDDVNRLNTALAALKAVPSETCNPQPGYLDDQIGFVLSVVPEEAPEEPSLEFSE